LIFMTMLLLATLQGARIAMGITAFQITA